MSLKRISDEIRRRRKLLKVTQLDLAEMSGLSLRTVKAIEKGSANPTMTVMNRLLEPLGLSLTIIERVRDE